MGDGGRPQPPKQPLQSNDLPRNSLGVQLAHDGSWPGARLSSEVLRRALHAAAPRLSRAACPSSGVHAHVRRGQRAAV